MMSMDMSKRINNSEVQLINRNTGEVMHTQTLEGGNRAKVEEVKFTHKAEINEKGMSIKSPFGTTLNLENVTFHNDFLNLVNTFGDNSRYTVVMEHNAVPKGKKLPKSKRLKKKYFKKHGHPHTTTIENVELNIEEGNTYLSNRHHEGQKEGVISEKPSLEKR